MHTYMVSCPTLTKNLEWYLTMNNILEQAAGTAYAFQVCHFLNSNILAEQSSFSNKYQSNFVMPLYSLKFAVLDIRFLLRGGY